MSITDFLFESNNDFNLDEWIGKGLGIKRNRMPQIDSDQMDYVVMHLSNKYKLKKMRIPVSKLLPIQSEINSDKVSKMVKKGDKPKLPFLVSKNYRLCDGTHSVASLLMRNPNEEVTVYRSNLDCKKLIEVLNKLKVTYKKELNESKKEFSYPKTEYKQDDITNDLQDTLVRQAEAWFDKNYTEDYWHFSTNYINYENVVYEIHSDKGSFLLGATYKGKKLNLKSIQTLKQ